MPTLIAERELRYGGTMYPAGARFEANDRDATLLTKIKRASLVAGVQPEPAPAPAPKPTPTEEPPPPPPDAPAENGETEGEEDGKKKSRSIYQRRDMRAEDGKAGQTGAAASPSSSPAAQASKESTSKASAPTRKSVAALRFGGSPSRKTSTSSRGRK